MERIKRESSPVVLGCGGEDDVGASSSLSSTNQQTHIGPTVCFAVPLLIEQQPAVVPSPSNSTNEQDDLISDEEARRRRELLARRPSYRKILNDLSGVELDLRQQQKDNSGDSGGESSEDSRTSESTMTGSQTMPTANTLPTTDANAIGPYSAFLPHGALQHLTGTSNGDLSGNSVGGLIPVGSGQNNLLQQYNPITDRAGGHHQQQLLIPMSGNDLLGLKPVLPGSAGAFVSSQGLINFSSPSSALVTSPASGSKMSMSTHGHGCSSSGSSSGGGGHGDDTTKKREIRLLKNREAAKECRRKKKEYVKCLENRVTVLEAQNKQLIEELRALKELYCRKGD